MKKLVFAFAALAATSLLADVPERTEKSAEDKAVRCRSLFARYGKSVATVRYYMKKGCEAEIPDMRVRYSCPACGKSHFSQESVSAARGLPAVFTGYLVGPDRVLMPDVMIEPRMVERIEVECAGETLCAEETEAAPERRALFLKTERPFASAEPLSFTAPADGEKASDLSRFYMVREAGETVAGVVKSGADGAVFHTELGKTLYRPRQNTLVVNDGNDAVTVALDEELEVGKEDLSAPGEWKTEPASARFERLASAEARVRKAVVPVTLYFEAKRSKGTSRYSFFSFGRDDNDDSDLSKDSVGIVFEGGRVVVPVKLAPGETERLEKIEANLGGRKAVLRFVGSFVDTGAIAAEFEGGVPEEVEPFRLCQDTPLEMRGRTFNNVEYSSLGGILTVRVSQCRLVKYELVRGNVVVSRFSRISGTKLQRKAGMGGMILDEQGRIVEFSAKARRSGSVFNGDFDAPQGERLAAIAKASEFDAENVPRRTVDRDRTPWLGIEVQPAGQDVVKQKKASAAVAGAGVRRPALVTSVAAGTPAAELGIKEGDIMLSVRYADSATENAVNMEDDSYSFASSADVFDNGGMLELMSGVSPWPDAEGGINNMLANYGVGAEVVIAWFSDGQRREGRTKLVVAPVHFQNAPRARNNELGITVCDMTYEVRKYLKLTDDAGGVVVRKVKGGGVAAVSGLRAYEIVMQVNGEDVKSAKDFLAKTKGKKELNFTVRRLRTTRMVPVKL